MRKVSLKMAAMLVVMAALIICGISTTSVYAAHEIAGSALLFTYYDVRPVADGGMGTADNYFTVTNTSASWVQAHVRIRTGDKSVELLDFDIMLSPEDVFSFTLSDNGAGGVDFSSLDEKTISNSKMIAPFLEDLGGGVKGIWFSTNPSSSHYRSGLTSLIQLCQSKTQAEAAALTRKGYVEVIEEGAITPCTDDKTKCDDVYFGDCTGDEDNWTTIGSNTLWDLVDDDMQSHSGKCDKAVSNAENNLHGRVYYATITNGVVVRLAHLNAETMDNRLPQLNPAVDSAERRIIIHRNNYDLERASERCLQGADSESESCFAYTEASSDYDALNSSTPGGADDMNYCFYQDTETIEGEKVGTYNKFGAAATFGPTIADLRGERDGDFNKTAGNLDLFSENSSFEWSAANGLSESGDLYEKDYVTTHYLYFPTGPFYIKSAFAFIFPVMHFIDEAPKVGDFVFYDMDENTVEIPETGFISPGLPGPGAPVDEEASLQTLSTDTPYDEGWVKIGAITATNGTSKCTTPEDVRDTGYSDSSDCLVRGGSDSYTPGYTGAYFVIGDSSVSASLLQYIGAYLEED
jgi:hypothetical protein